MIKNYKSQGVSLSNKFYIIPEPVQLTEWGEDITADDERWLAKSRRMQARRWRKLKYEQI